MSASCASWIGGSQKSYARKFGLHCEDRLAPTCISHGWVGLGPPLMDKRRFLVHLLTHIWYPFPLLQGKNSFSSVCGCVCHWMNSVLHAANGWLARKKVPWTDRPDEGSPHSPQSQDLGHASYFAILFTKQLPERLEETKLTLRVMADTMSVDSLTKLNNILGGTDAQCANRTLWTEAVQGSLNHSPSNCEWSWMREGYILWVITGGRYGASDSCRWASESLRVRRTFSHRSDPCIYLP